MVFNSNKKKPMGSFNLGMSKPVKQSGKFGSIKRDAGRVALKPGKRVSRTGKVYYETRKNRSDSPELNKGMDI
jgi:hypothetical protein